MHLFQIHTHNLGRKFLLVIILIWFSQNKGFSQNDKIEFRFLTREQGLSNSSVNTIFQDSKNYIWFGTEDGLNRFDGYNITVYKNNAKVQSSLSNNFVNDILEDKQHRIWIATNYGINIYDRNTDQFTRYMHQPKVARTISSNIILSLYEDKKGNVWVGTTDGLNKFDVKTNSFKLFRYKSVKSGELFENKFNCIFEDENENLWLGTDGAGIKKFSLKNEKFIVTNQKDDLNKALSGIRIICIDKDKSQNIWIGTNGKGLFLYDKFKRIKNYKKDQPYQNSISNNVIRSLICDRNNNLWVGTENGGLNLKQSNANGFTSYENDQRKPLSFSSKTASSLLEDSQGNIWIGTHHGGVNIYSPNLTNFKSYTKGIWAGALSYNDIKGFVEMPNGDIWVGSDGGGINVFNQATGKFSQYRHDAQNPNSIGSDAILSMMKDSKGTIWVNTWGGGLNRYNPKTNNFTKFLHDANDKNSISSNYPYYSYENKKGEFWVAAFYSGLNKFDRNTNKFTKIEYAQDGKTKFTGTYVVSIHEDVDENLWVGTIDGGLNCYTANRKHFIHYFSDNEGDMTDAVRTIFTDSKNRLWVGKTGLYLFDKNKKSFALFSKNQYLVNEQIQSIIEDKKGNLWIGTNNGLIQFNPDTKNLKRYTTADGLQGLEFCQNSALLTSKGQMLFGGFQGFNIFNPDNITEYDFKYPTYITDLSILNKSINSGTNKTTINKYISENKKVILDYDQSVISFDFAALNFVSPKKTNYAYKLEGFDKGWNYTGNQRKATYTNLDPGEYTFFVKSSSADGLWNTKPASVKIEVKPPFYLTWWFELISICLIGFSIFIILYYRRKSELRAIHEANKEKLHQLQLQFFTNISHEFRTPLTLIMGTLEQVFKINNDSIFAKHYHTINRNANRLMHLISELMDFRKTESGALKLKVMPGNFSSFLREISDDFKDQANLHGINFVVKQEKEFSNVWYDRQILEKAILNILNNAFKYTSDNGSVNIEVTSSLQNFNPKFSDSIKIEHPYQSKNYLYIIVSDTGIGISKSSLENLFEPYYRVSDVHVGTGIGLAFVKSLVFLHKGNIYVHSEYKKGTQIILAIPCDETDYQSEELWPKNSQNITVQLESIQFKNEFKEPNLQSDKLVIEASENKKKACILIVDDNTDLRNYFREVLEKDYYVIEAEDGEKGLVKAKEESPGLIISDVMMPIMDGIEFCKTIKEDFETSHIPFILLTAKDALESRLQGVESGADYYFSKPVSTDLLLLTIKNQFNQQQKIKERYLKDYQVEVRDLVHSTKDKNFMDQLLKIIEAKLEDPELNIDYVSREIGVSKSKLYKKIKDITGQSSNEFVRTIRLKKSMEIMTHEDVSVTEVMYRVGISSHSYFTTAFKKEFGITPSKFQQQLDKKLV